MNKVYALNRVFFLIMVLSLFACSEKILPPKELQPAEIDIAVKDTSEADVRQEKYDQGITAMSVRDYPGAKRIFTEFIRENPEMAGGYLNLALIHYKSNEYGQALKLVERVIGLNNRQSQAYNLRAQLLILNSKILEARDSYINAIELNPNYANAQYNLALLYDVYLQDVKLAIQHYEIYMSLITVPDETTRNWIEHLKRNLNNG